LVIFLPHFLHVMVGVSTSVKIECRYNHHVAIHFDDAFHPEAIDGLALDRIAPLIAVRFVVNDPPVENHVPDIQDVDVPVVEPVVAMGRDDQAFIPQLPNSLDLPPVKALGAWLRKP
jgi:hypothetical protein